MKNRPKSQVLLRPVKDGEKIVYIGEDDGTYFGTVIRKNGNLNIETEDKKLYPIEVRP